MSKVLAVINFIDRHGRPVDPGYGVPGGEHPDQGLPGGGEYPDQGLPGGEGPVDPGYGVGLPPVIDNGLPGRPPRPDQGLPPTYPVKPDQGLPNPPQVWPKPPLGIWPPLAPVYPTHPIYPVPEPGAPSHPIALPPGSVWPPLPPEVSGKILAFCWLVGIGYRWVVIDPSQKPGFPDNSLPGSGGVPSQPIAETPQPKR